jgi:hypothetical protein
MIFKTPEQLEEDRYCNSTPLGEKWPICNLYQGHRSRHESADFFWYDSGPAIMKGTENDPAIKTNS